MDFTQLIETLLILFAVLLLGYVAGKCHIIDEHGQKTLSGYIVKISSPLLILSSVTGENLDGDKSSIFVVFLVGLGMYIFLPVLARVISVVFRANMRDRTIYEMMLIFSNASFLGFPVLRAMYGNQAVFYCAIIGISFNLCIYSYGVYRFMKGKDESEQVKIPFEKVLNPGVIAAVLAMVIYFFELPVPSVVSGFCSMVGETTIPLSMIIIGVSLSFVRIRELFSEPRIYLYCVIRLLILPVLSYYIMSMITDDVLLIAVVTIIQAMPAGTLNTVLSTEYGGNSKLASQGVFLSTLCCIMTIPVITMLFLI